MDNLIQTVKDYIQSLPFVIKFQSMPIVFKVVFAAGLLILLFGILIMRSKNRKLNVEHWSNADYQDTILNPLSNNAKLDYSYLYRAIDEIYNLAQRYQNHLDIQKIAVAEDIEHKIIELQKQIQRKWSQIEKEKEFYHCIALHYASFTLANSIKQEQEILRDAFVKSKIECDRLSKEIKKLNRSIPNAHGSQRYELMQQHKKLCDQHKHLCQIKSVFGRRNTEYLEQVKKQNRITAKYREYIIFNCGQKGRRWGRKLRMRKLDQVSYNK